MPQPPLRRPPPRSWNSVKQQKKSGTGIIVFFSILTLLIAGGGGAAIYFLFIRKPPDSEIPGALSVADLEALADDFNAPIRNPALRVSVPGELDEAIRQIERTIGDGVPEPAERKGWIRQKLIAIEWLFGQEVPDDKFPRIAKALAESFTERLGEDYKPAILKAFRRFGTAEYVHLFLDQDPFRKYIGNVLDLIELFPTDAGIRYAVEQLESNFGDRAAGIFRQFGQGHVNLLVPYYDSSETVVMERVRKIFSELEVDVDKTRLEYYLTRAAAGDGAAWRIVSSVPFRVDLQGAVLDGLRRANRGRTDSQGWIEACHVWGDVSMVPLIQQIYRGNYPFDTHVALELLVKYPDPSTVPILIDRLLNSWQNEADAIVQALLDLEDSGISIDWRRDIHIPVCRRYNDFGLFQRPAFKNLLDATGFDPNLLLDQCLEDLQSSEKAHESLSTLSRMDIIEERRHEVAEAISSIMTGDAISEFRDEGTFLRWATPENSRVYTILNTDKFGGNNWIEALRIALKGADNEQKLIVPVAKAFGDFFKNDEVVAVLVEMGSDIEPLMITMLHSDNSEELIGAAKVLQVVGTEKCIPPLRELLDLAKRVRDERVFNAVQMAGEVIMTRVGVEKVKAWEEALKKQKEREKEKSSEEEDKDG